MHLFRKINNLSKEGVARPLPKACSPTARAATARSPAYRASRARSEVIHILACGGSSYRLFACCVSWQINRSGSRSRHWGRVRCGEYAIRRSYDRSQVRTRHVPTAPAVPLTAPGFRRGHCQSFAEPIDQDPFGPAARVDDLFDELIRLFEDDPFSGRRFRAGEPKRRVLGARDWELGRDPASRPQSLAPSTRL